MKHDYHIEFKAKVASWAVDEECGIAGASEKFDVPPEIVYEWTTAWSTAITPIFRVFWGKERLVF